MRATSFADSPHGLDVHAHVDDLNQHFRAPEPEPFIEQRRVTAVVDDILGYLRSHRFRGRTEVNLTLDVPPHLDEPGLGPRVATPFVTVLIWVAIWSPIESLLYDGWSLARLRRAYAIMARIRVRIVVDGSGSAAAVRNERSPSRG